MVFTCEQILVSDYVVGSFSILSEDKLFSMLLWPKLAEAAAATASSNKSGVVGLPAVLRHI
jgi:hypothetical protein